MRSPIVRALQSNLGERGRERGGGDEFKIVVEVNSNREMFVIHGWYLIEM